MKTTTKNPLLVLFLSLICVTLQLSRCDDSASILEDREKEAEQLEKLIRKEVIASLQLLNEDDDDDLARLGDGERIEQPNKISQSSSNEPNARYYVTSQGEGKPSDKLEASREWNKNTRNPSYYGDNSKNARELEDVPPNKLNPSSYLQRNYQYGLAPSQTVGSDDNPKITRMNEYSYQNTDKNTREPVSNEFYTYPTTYTSLSLPLSRSRVSIGRYGSGGGYGSAGGNWGGGGGLIGRGVRRLGGRLRNRFGAGGSGGAGWGYGGGLGYGAGAGRLANLNIGGSGGGRRQNSLGITGGGGRRLIDFSVAGSGDRWLEDLDGSNDRYNWRYSGGQSGGTGLNIVTSGTPTQSSSSGSGLNVVTGGTPSNRYYRYGVPTDTNTPTAQEGRLSSINSGTGGSSQYQVTYPNQASTVTTTTTTTQSDLDTSDEDPIQYELLFLKNKQTPSNTENQFQTTQTQTIPATSGSQIQLNSGSGSVPLSSGTTGGDLRTVNTVTTSNDPNSQKVKEYRLVVVNDDNPTETKMSTSGQGGVSLLSSSGPSNSASSWTTVSSNGSPSSSNGQSSSWTTVSANGGSGSGAGSMSSSRRGFQVNTPNTSLQLRLPSSSVVNSVLNTVQGGVNPPTVIEQQTRSMNDGAGLGSGKIIRVIPVAS